MLVLAGHGQMMAVYLFLRLPQKKTPEQLVAEAKAEKQTRLDFATTKIVVWQTKLLMGRKLTDEESTQLNAWMDYIDAVTTIDPSTAPDVIWPELPEE